MGAGRPKEYTPERLNEIIKKMEEYTESTELPIAAEFAYLNKIRRTTLYDHKELSNALENMIAKKEFTLLRKGLDGDYNSQIVKLALAQLGYSDKQETQHTTIDDNGEPTGFSIEFIK